MLEILGEMLVPWHVWLIPSSQTRSYKTNYLLVKMYSSQVESN